ncbi:hypothetical protein SteCoe_32516 [Stentor coeruleus]|uniref:GOLD domain-containing protein n=1 Tax=Stentor coeruleus TaxID=5963 RepID=A0A1R2AYV1_9CILI|nr:hypothetical protein SteCoe_32516 [Stentor coeruleus]
MNFFYFLVCLGVYSELEGVIVDEGATLEVDETSISLEVLEIITDINKDDQPTRINNSNSGKTYYILESEGVEYFVTIDSSILPETVFSESFLQITKN